MACMTNTPWNGNYRGVGGLHGGGGGGIVNVSWNYTLQFTHITVNLKL